ncbi:hypothetical protein GGR57DRAFT_489727 [Xylariaceae sp. FL1272]|nr:hypothetical protein GGR57DRAFT_489727 [Xylariaceae sp. FL1272]
MSETYNLDPQGAVLLTIRNPDAPFAIWPKDEGTEASVRADGLHHFDAQDWDKDTLVVFMSMVHGHNHRVPKLMDLESLAKIALVMDYYQCYDVAKALVQGEVRRDFVLGDAFKLATKVAIEQCKEPLPTLGLSIPSTIINKVEHHRRQHIHRIITILYDLLAHFRDARSECSFECCSILLGSLTKGLHNRRLKPQPELSYRGHSHTSTMQAVSNIRSPKWRSISSRSKRPHSCDLTSIIQSKMNGLLQLEGLELYRKYKR